MSLLESYFRTRTGIMPIKSKVHSIR